MASPHLVHTCKTSLLFTTSAVAIHSGCSTVLFYTPTKLLIWLSLNLKVFCHEKTKFCCMWTLNVNLDDRLSYGMVRNGILASSSGSALFAYLVLNFPSRNGFFLDNTKNLHLQVWYEMGVDFGQHTRIWYLLHQRTVKAQMSPHICSDSPEPLPLTFSKYRSRERPKPNIRSLIPLDTSEWVFNLLPHRRLLTLLQTEQTQIRQLLIRFCFAYGNMMRYDPT